MTSLPKEVLQYIGSFSSNIDARRTLGMIPEKVIIPNKEEFNNFLIKAQSKCLLLQDAEPHKRELINTLRNLSFLFERTLFSSTESLDIPFKESTFSGEPGQEVARLTIQLRTLTSTGVRRLTNSTVIYSLDEEQ